MKLSDYLAMTNKSAAKFAVEIGASTSAVNFWRSGERTPRIKQMQKIFDATSGAVTPNDFLQLPFRGEESAHGAQQTQSETAKEVTAQ